MARTTKKTAAAPKRSRREPAVRAQVELDTARRVLERVVARRDVAYEEYKGLVQEADRLEKRVKYLAANPDLPVQDVEESGSDE